jgi:hypothetical protein
MDGGRRLERKCKCCFVRVAQDRRAQIDREAFDRQAQHGQEINFDAREISDSRRNPFQRHAQGNAHTRKECSHRRSEEAGTQHDSQAEHLPALTQHNLAWSPWRRSTERWRRGG